MKLYEKRIGERDFFRVNSEVINGKLLFDFIITNGDDYEKTILTAPEVVQLIARLEGRL